MITREDLGFRIKDFDPFHIELICELLVDHHQIINRKAIQQSRIDLIEAEKNRMAGLVCKFLYGNILDDVLALRNSTMRSLEPGPEAMRINNQFTRLIDKLSWVGFRTETGQESEASL